MKDYKMIVEQSYWDDSYKGYKLKPLPNDDSTRILINQYIPYSNNFLSAFEPGCFPGRFLLEIGRKGYILNGCDITPRVEEDLKIWLENDEGCKVGEIMRCDFNDVNEGIKYDLVCSFGFIEHFENYTDIFAKQLRLVKDNGLALIQFPNFYGIVQRFLHYHLDRNNFDNHIIQAMNINNYLKIIPPEFTMIFVGYYGNFEFWNNYEKNNNRLKRYILHHVYKTKKWWKRIPNSKLWSPYGAIILKKIK